MAQHAYIKNLATSGRQNHLANRLYLSVETILLFKFSFSIFIRFQIFLLSIGTAQSFSRGCSTRVQ